MKTNCANVTQFNHMDPIYTFELTQFSYLYYIKCHTTYYTQFLMKPYKSVRHFHEYFISSICDLTKRE